MLSRIFVTKFDNGEKWNVAFLETFLENGSDSVLKIPDYFRVGVIPSGAAFQAEGGISPPAKSHKGDPSAGCT
jgi:hypothetical protein